MNDIFADKNLYPHKGKIKDYFKDFYESVYISFLPFFKISNHKTEKKNPKKSERITLQEAIKKNALFKNLEPDISRDIYSYDNKNYPTALEIFENGKAITWSEIINGSGLINNSELNKALLTSIGALREVFSKPELTEKLNNYSANQGIWHPTEGSFDTLSKVAIYKAFKLLEKDKIVVTDEFFETTSTLELNQVTDFEFVEKIGFKDYYIYSLDKELLFTIEWDSFFFLIATDKEKMNKIISESLFESFLCDEKTKHDWEYKEGEIQNIWTWKKTRTY